MTNMSVLTHVLNHVLSLIFAFEQLLGSLVPFFNVGEKTAVICSLGGEFNDVCRICDPQHL